MSTFEYRKNPYDVHKIIVDNAEIKRATIVKDLHKNGVDFVTVLFTFFIGAFSLAVALAFNSFSKSIIDNYGLTSNVQSNLIYVTLVTTISLLLVWIAWKFFPDRVVSALS